MRCIVDPNLCEKYKLPLTQSTVWHDRMCHLGLGNLKRLSTIDKQVDLGGLEDGFKCEECIEAKMTRRSFPRSTKPRSTEPLELVHMDFNIINVPGRGNEVVALILTDDASLCRFSFPMKSRKGEDILRVFLQWVAWAERQTGNKLKSVHPDNANEFVKGVFAEKMQHLGVHVLTGVPYEHEQNGAAEISNRILMTELEVEC